MGKASERGVVLMAPVIAGARTAGGLDDDDDDDDRNRGFYVESRRFQLIIGI